MVFWFQTMQTWSEYQDILEEPKMEMKYATEYLTAKKWASKS